MFGNSIPFIGKNYNYKKLVVPKACFLQSKINLKNSGIKCISRCNIGSSSGCSVTITYHPYVINIYII